VLWKVSKRLADAMAATQRPMWSALAVRASHGLAVESQGENFANYGGIPCGFDGVDTALTAQAPPE